MRVILTKPATVAIWRDDDTGGTPDLPAGHTFEADDWPEESDHDGHHEFLTPGWDCVVLPEDCYLVSVE